VEFFQVVKANDFDDSGVRLLKQIFVYTDLNLPLNRIQVLFVYQDFQEV